MDRCSAGHTRKLAGIMTDEISEVVLMYRSIIESDMEMDDKLKYLDEVRKLKPPSENRWNFRYVIWAIALVAISSPLMFLAFAVQGKEVDPPEAMLTLSSTAVGALAAYITSALKK